MYSPQATWNVHVLGVVQVSWLDVFESYIGGKNTTQGKWKTSECAGRSADLDEKGPDEFSEASCPGKLDGSQLIKEAQERWAVGTFPADSIQDMSLYKQRQGQDKAYLWKNGILVGNFICFLSSWIVKCRGLHYWNYTLPANELKGIHLLVG